MRYPKPVNHHALHNVFGEHVAILPIYYDSLSLSVVMGLYTYLRRPGQLMDSLSNLILK